MGKALPSGYQTGMTPRNKARQLPSRCGGEQRGVNALGQVSWRGLLATPEPASVTRPTEERCWLAENRRQRLRRRERQKPSFGLTRLAETK